MRLEHPSGCACPAPEILESGIVLSVHTCPLCLSWERGRRSAGFIQVELFPTEEGSGDQREGHEAMDACLEPDPSETLTAIRAVDPQF